MLSYYLGSVLGKNVGHDRVATKLSRILLKVGVRLTNLSSSVYNIGSRILMY